MVAGSDDCRIDIFMVSPEPQGARVRRNHIPRNVGGSSSIGRNLLGSRDLTRREAGTNHLTTPNRLSTMASLVSAEWRTQGRPKVGGQL